MFKGEFIPGGRMSYQLAGENHGIQGGENAGGEKVSGGRKCVSLFTSRKAEAIKLLFCHEKYFQLSRILFCNLRLKGFCASLSL